MTDSKVSADDGSAAIGGDVNAPMVNVKADGASTVSVVLEHHVNRELPSFLGHAIVIFSLQSLSEYGRGMRRTIPPEVLEKLKHNGLRQDHRIIKDYNRYALFLEQAYLGVEQKNADARFLVRRKAGIAYESEIMEASTKFLTPPAQVIEYVRENVDAIIERVVNRLLEDYKHSADVKVEQEIAHLAVSLIVADAVIECEVLEKS